MPSLEQQHWQQKIDAIINSQDSVDDKINALLMLGLTYFSMSIAIVAEINKEKDTYKVLYCQLDPKDKPLEPGMEFNFSKTYCSFTYNANRPISFTHAGEAIAEHPCYQNFKLESYIGCKLIVGDKIVGTVNFSDPAIHEPDFSYEDFEFMQNLCQTISGLFGLK